MAKITIANNPEMLGLVDMKANIVFSTEQGEELALQLVKPLPARALCYLYRAAHLERMLVDPENAAFLRSQGYESLDVQGALSTLCTRLCVREEFPHEIGLFLGYPLGDVVGFMEHRAKTACAAAAGRRTPTPAPPSGNLTASTSAPAYTAGFTAKDGRSQN